MMDGYLFGKTGLFDILVFMSTKLLIFCVKACVPLVCSISPLYGVQFAVNPPLVSGVIVVPKSK